MYRIIMVVLAVALVTSAAAAEKESAELQTWRAPTAAELGSAQQQKWRENDATRYLTLTGDFDGDGKPDAARLLVRSDGKAFALFVKLAARDTILKLDEFPDMSTLPVIGIKRVAPNTYPTACARGLDCAEDEPRYIHLTHEAIDFFKHDSASTYYYWNAVRHGFEYVGITG
jgi:hypothetical protein